MSGDGFDTYLSFDEIVGCFLHSTTQNQFRSSQTGRSVNPSITIPRSGSEFEKFTVVVYAPKIVGKNRKMRENARVKLRRKTFTFLVDEFPTFNDNHQLARKWQWRLSPVLRAREVKARLSLGISAKEQVLLSSPPRSPRVVVVINPYGGTRKAKRLFYNYAAPVFRQAGIEFVVEITKSQGFARKMAEEMDVGSVDAIIACSGDGIIHEVETEDCLRET